MNGSFIDSNNNSQGSTLHDMQNVYVEARIVVWIPYSYVNNPLRLPYSPYSDKPYLEGNQSGPPPTGGNRSPTGSGGDATTIEKYLTGKDDESTGNNRTSRKKNPQEPGTSIRDMKRYKLKSIYACKIRKWGMEPEELRRATHVSPARGMKGPKDDESPTTPIVAPKPGNTSAKFSNSNDLTIKLDDCVSIPTNKFYNWVTPEIYCSLALKITPHPGMTGRTGHAPSTEERLGQTVADTASGSYTQGGSDPRSAVNPHFLVNGTINIKKFPSYAVKVRIFHNGRVASKIVFWYDQSATESIDSELGNAPVKPWPPRRGLGGLNLMSPWFSKYTPHLGGDCMGLTSFTIKDTELELGAMESGRQLDDDDISIDIDNNNT